MADFVFNIAKGRVVEFYNRVDSNDPANSVFTCMLVVDSGETDDAMGDTDTFTALLALALLAEATNTGYARVTVDDTDLSAFAPDDTNNRFDVDMPDIVFPSVSAGDNPTQLIIGYDNDSTGGTDANIVPCTSHDFSVTPAGGDVTAQVHADGFFRAA